MLGFTLISSGGTEHEAMAANGDSGGAVFVDDGIYWELGGVIYTILQYDGQDADDALYGNLTYAADLSYYRDQILDIVYPCDNGIDDDGDVGAPDPVCIDAPWQNFESPLSCGLGFELVLLLPALLWWHRRRLARV